MTTPIVSIRNVSVRYPMGNQAPDLVALENMSIDIGEGEFVTLIGPSGCGKSTLLNAVGGLLASTQGDIFVCGARVRKPLPEKIAVVFQQYTLFPWRTVLDNVEIGLEFRGIAKQRRRSEALRQLKMVGLQGFEHVYPRQLSGGMKQRVAIARALSLGTDILLMDEPFGALDEQTRIILGEELSQILEKTGKTILFVTHSLSEAVYLSDRIAVLSARPARIKEMLDVGLERPRQPGMMTSEHFDHLRNYLFELLHEESRKSISQGLQGPTSDRRA